eukprot:INCI5145.6.p1 GENE.INCI5145.6~~INCI5145.6.p1  ORF type:complete len:1264 (+),score=248.62 INCI5145.6:289-3792(+)
MSATLAKRKKPLASGKSKAKSKKKGFDSRYALPSQEEQQVLRQIGLDAATLSKNRAGAAGAMVGGGDADLKNSLMGGGDDGAAGTALAQSGLEVAHNSNLWGIQTKDLLKEQTFDYDHTAALTDALRTIKASVDSVPVPEEPVSRDSVDPRFMCTFLRRNDAADAADQPSVTLNFASPSAVDIVGSFLIRTQVRGPGANVDMALEMPDSCLDAKDYLNNRYFEKRALYLAVIAEHLEKEVGQQFDVRVSHFRDDERKSMLVLRAKDSAEGNEGENDTEDAKKSKKKKKKKKKKRSKAKSFPEIRILVTVSPTCQSLTIKRLRPGRTNVRVYGHTYGAPGTPEGALPTPHYSSAIVEDMCFKTHLQQLHVVAQKYPGFPGAVVLLKLWLSRRRYNCRSVGDGPDTARQNEEILITDTDCAGVTGFHLSMVLLHLVWQNKVQVHMQPLQMFRVALQFLGQRKGDSDVVASTGIVMCPRDKLGEAKLPTADELTEMRSLFDVVMLECVSPLNENVRLNIAARVSREALTDLAWEARRSLELLQHGDPVLGFEALFLSPHSMADRFDQLLTVRFPAAPPRFYAEDDHGSGAPKKDSKNAKPKKKGTSDAPDGRQSESHPVNDSLALVEAACNYGWRRACEVRLSKLIRRGLGNRLQGFRIVRVQETPLPLHRRRRVAGTGVIDNRGDNAGHTVVLGLLLDDDEAFRQIDKGPPATDKAAVRAFRLFWGARAELRRFKDGSILETVLWGPDDAPPRLAHQLPGVILTHLLNRHFGGCSAVSSASALDHLVRTREMDVQAPPDDVKAENKKKPGSRTGNVETGDTLGGGGRGEEVVGRTLALLMEFRRLETLLKNMSGVELKVEDVRPAAPEFAYASLMPPRGVPTSVDGNVHLPAHALMAPLRVVVSFEASMRWPGTNSKALATCKSAFYLKMADALRRSKVVERARPLQDALEVQLRHTNVLFHIVIALERAWEFAAKEAEEEAVAKAEKRAAPAASQALQVRAANKRAIARRKEAALGFQQVPVLEREERHRVFHVGVLHGLAVQHRSFSPAVRLAKLWVARSMLSGHVPDEAVELLVAHTFADPGPFDEPHGAAAALLRFFKLVSTFDWRGEPLIVDLDRAAAGRGHSNSRKKKQRFFGAANATATTTEVRKTHCGVLQWPWTLGFCSL